MRAPSWFFGVVPIVSLLGGCDEGSVGEPCIPEEEYSERFSGFELGEVSLESRSFQCETRLCLVNHFEGRVSCPYGQTEEQAVAGSETSCVIPGASGDLPGDQVTVEVEPQYVERRPEDAVYCSCRCAGPDPNASYCECPSGFECVELPELSVAGAISRRQLVGSYCIKQGTRFSEASAPTERCDASRQNCGDARPL